MCEFCLQHAEGKKWYLEMKHFSEELLHQELSPESIKLSGATDRLGFIYDALRTSVIPAGTGTPYSAGPNAGSQVEVTREESTRRAKLIHFGQILPIEDVEKVIDLCSSIVRMPCGCRFITTGKTNNRYCFGLGFDPAKVMGAYPDSTACLEVLANEDAKRIIKKFDEEGLIHSIWTMITPYVGAICNCDHDCLWYKSNIENADSISAFRAEYVCKVDAESCTGCKSCMSQCQFGAQFYSSAMKLVFIDPKRCYGCGVCRAACPNKAISIIPRAEMPEAAQFWVPNMK
jgi:ferredoxin